MFQKSQDQDQVTMVDTKKEFMITQGPPNFMYHILLLRKLLEKLHQRKEELWQEIGRQEVQKKNRFQLKGRENNCQVKGRLLRMRGGQPV